MAFNRRTSKPTSADATWKYFIHSDKYNPYPSISNGCVMPNCTGYAFGRYEEILGSFPDKLGRGNAGEWYDGSTSCERGSDPALGAIACWSGGFSGYGHVAIVEEICSDGSIWTSESNYGGSFWEYKHRYNNGNWGGNSKQTFQGFIYNPNGGTAENKLSSFLVEASGHVGENNTWTCNTTGYSRTSPWCAAFIMAVAKTIGILDIIIPNTYGAGDVPRIGVPKNMGKWISGPHNGHSATPQPGDIILFRYNKMLNKDKYYSDHIGIVEDVSNNTVNTIEGNYNNRVGNGHYSLNDKTINGYYRPDWGKVSGYSVGGTQTIYGPLYSTQNTREDATIREVAYMNTQYEPSIKSTNTKLSVLNYTSLLGSIFDVIRAQNNNFASVNYNTSSNLDKVASVPRSIIQYIENKGLNTAASVGICANIKHESNYNTASIGDNGTSFGICQWHYGRGTAMKTMAGSNWKNNLSGQLDYLWYELSNSYKTSTLNKLKLVANTEAGAREAADIFVRNFEKPANIDSQSKIRQNSASEIWNQITLQS